MSNVLIRVDEHLDNLSGIKIHPDVFQGTDELPIVAHNLLSRKGGGQNTRVIKKMTTYKYLNCSKMTGQKEFISGLIA